MLEKEAALDVFAQELFPEDKERVARALKAVVTLEEGDPIEADEIRTIEINGQKAVSVKLYNLMRVSFYDLSDFLLKGAGIGMFEETRWKIVYSFLLLLHEFYPKLRYEFDEQDSRLLLAIMEQNLNEFDKEELGEAYRQSFSKEIVENRLIRAIDSLTELRVLKYKGRGKYSMREKMIYER